MGGIGEHACFFYLRLLDGAAIESGGRREGIGIGPGGIDYLIRTFGVGRFFAEVDRGRCFEGGSIIEATLEWVAGEGFAETILRHGIDQYPSAQAYRDRHIVQLTRDLRGLLGSE